MSNIKYEIDFNLLKVSVLITFILAILKLSNVISINNWIVFLPVIIYFTWLFLLVFLIGLMTIFLFVNRNESTDSGDSEEQDNDNLP